MAIARDILSGLFGATAGGLRGYAVQQAEERERMQRQQEKQEERAYQMGLIEKEREYAQRVATERDLLEGRIRRANRPEVDTQPRTLPPQLLRDVVSGAAPGIGMAAGATGPSPLSIARGGREALPEAELRADFTPTAMAPPARGLIERGGQLYEVITPEEQAARMLQAERGGLDAIEVARLREVARGSEASPERETARAILSDIDVSYRTEEEARAIERAERLRDTATAREQAVLDFALETLSQANLESLERDEGFLSPDMQAQLIAPLIKMAGLPPEMVARVVDASSEMQITPAPSAGEGGDAGTPTEAEAPTRRESYLNTLDAAELSAALERVVAGESIEPEQILTPSITRQKFEEDVQPRMRDIDRLLEATRNQIKLAQSSGLLGLGSNVGELRAIESELIKRKNQIIEEAGGSALSYYLGGSSPYRILERGEGN